MKKILQLHIRKILLLVFLLLIFLLIIMNSSLLKSVYENFSLWLYPNNSSRNGELLKIILSFIGGLGILYGLYISLQRVKAMEKGVEKQGEAINNQSKQIELTRKSQTDERFKNAIEHLGSDKNSIILGGIAELHQIGKDNKNEYSKIIFDLLCSYIRTNSDKNKSIIILQTIFDNLFSKTDDNPYLSYKANLKNSNLTGIDMNNYQLNNANLSNCSLSNINNSELKNANLNRTYFFISHLTNVDFKGADLSNSYFYNATIDNCNIENIKEDGRISFVDSLIKNVKFDYLKIIDWDFLACDIVRCSFNYSEVIYSNFSATRFGKVDFYNLEFFSNNFFIASIFTKVTMKSFTGTNIIFKGITENGNFHRSGLKTMEYLLENNDNTEISGIDFIDTNIPNYSEKITMKDIEKIRIDYDKMIKHIFERTKAESYKKMIK